MLGGWNVQVLNVGATVYNQTLWAEDPYIMLDDWVHPNCKAIHLISDMIQHAILTNLANASCTGKASFQPRPIASMDLNHHTLVKNNLVARH